MTSEFDYDIVTVTASKLVRRPDMRVAILLTGHRRANEPYSVAFEVTMETLSLLRNEFAKAEVLLSGPGGSADGQDWKILFRPRR